MANIEYPDALKEYFEKHKITDPDKQKKAIAEFARYVPEFLSRFNNLKTDADKAAYALKFL